MGSSEERWKPNEMLCSNVKDRDYKKNGMPNKLSWIVKGLSLRLNAPNSPKIKRGWINSQRMLSILWISMLEDVNLRLRSTLSLLAKNPNWLKCLHDSST